MRKTKCSRCAIRKERLPTQEQSGHLAQTSGTDKQGTSLERQEIILLVSFGLGNREVVEQESAPDSQCTYKEEKAYTGGGLSCLFICYLQSTKITQDSQLIHKHPL